MKTAPILDSDVSSITSLDVSSNKNIASLAGIEYFTALTELRVQNNYMAEFRFRQREYM